MGHPLEEGRAQELLVVMPSCPRGPESENRTSPHLFFSFRITKYGDLSWHGFLRSHESYEERSFVKDHI